MPGVFHTRSVRSWSVGHGARPLDEFLAVLAGADIRVLADIRTFPGSRRHPHFGQAALRDALAQRGIEYVHLRGLGGRRDPRPDSPNTALRVDAFRGYADHMATAEFADDLARLEAFASASRTVFMCAETLWWRCHRRLVADAVTVRGHEVIHLITAETREPHRLWDVARVADGALVYDGGALPLPAT
jgi:uncharacterized protein (DUF488 family)